jgi:asparagine synthase (glutamine-hydrolysing)
MPNEDETVWVTYNGEIYNFRELRVVLEERGHSFRSQTDTEVLVHGYEEWGIEGLLTRLCGMFAFALYDIQPRRPNGLSELNEPNEPARLHRRNSPIHARLILVKDRFGIKPLYYCQDHNRLLFASEVRALMRTGMVPDERSVEALVRFLQLGSIPMPLTTVKQVLALPAGHYLVVDQDGATLKQYWGLSSTCFFPERCESQSLEQAAATTRSLLDTSVKQHLVSDVPLGVFLSGGTDSSALVALANQFRDKPLTTISLAFDEPGYNEAPYARLVAEQYQTDHHEIVLQGKDCFHVLPQVFAAMDQPTVDGVNTYFVSKAAKQVGVTVVLSGIGGDEVFLGYDHLKKIHSLDGPRDLFNKLPLWVRKSLINTALYASSLVGKSGLEKLSYLEDPSEENVYLMFRGIFSPRQVQDLLGITERELTAFGPLASWQNGATPRSRNDSASCFEFDFYLQNQLLKDADCMSMVHSIETRVPFLDHRLVEYVQSLPMTMKLRNGVNKPLLLKALGDGFPSAVWNRQKMGFTFPLARWLQQRGDEFQAYSLAQQLFPRKAVEGIWKAFREGRMHWSRPWALIVLNQTT